MTFLIFWFFNFLLLATVGQFLGHFKPEETIMWWGFVISTYLGILFGFLNGRNDAR